MEVKPLRSFASGGRLLSVHGTNLDSIQKPQMAVYMDDGITVANVTVRKTKRERNRHKNIYIYICIKARINKSTKAEKI